MEPTLITNEDGLRLRADLCEAFPGLECRKALTMFDGDRQKAAEYLTSGRWRMFKSVSWGDSLRQNIETLSYEFWTHYSDVPEILKNCANNLDLARRVLNKEPLLP